MKILLFITAAAFMCIQQINAQSLPAKKKYLSVGDSLPTIQIADVLNFSSAAINLNDYKGKLLILDFWSFNCSSCIGDFAKLESIQKKFADKVQVFLVNSNTPKATLDFFTRRKKKIPVPDLPLITNDTTLSNYFPKNYYPWYVWIDSKGFVKYITDEIGDEYIGQYLNNEKVELTQRIFVDDWKQYTPIMEQVENHWLNYVKTYSYISSCIVGAQLGNFNPEYGEWKPGYVRLSQYCNSVLGLLQMAFSENEKYNFYSRNKIFMDVRDTLRFTPPYDKSIVFDEWESMHCYSYDLIVPKENTGNMYKMMREDLTGYFNLEVKIEKRNIKCLALIRTGLVDKLATKGKVGKYDGILFTKYNIPFPQFVSRLQQIFNSVYKIGAPIVDQSGYTGNIDIKLNTELIGTYFTLFRKELQKYGLDLVEKELPQDVLVIREKINNL